MGRIKMIFLWVLLLAAVIALFEMTSLDLLVQDHLFNFETGRWLVDRKAPMARFLFYTGVKGAIIAFGVSILLRYGLSFRKKGKGGAREKWARQRCLMVILALIIVPSTIAELKAVTNIYCPSQIERYGGDKPYVKLFEAYPERCGDCDSGRCFPAGHASGGFSFLVLYHVFREKKRKMAGLGVGLALGWVMGGYQMMKGAHFLSHTVVTMVVAWILILCIVEVCRLIHRDDHQGYRI